ncbi:MFS transporter [Granulicella sp. WH15]|uniref:MFS transporter n=1 Tax=Granulicella sp. WH15 TaxID=2602070 RepID=UPI0013679642|nr:MFS transporter [Granulicella sp. WH15]QHN04669.1 MFS transporter [Granulicella sp. WH15]
MRLKTTSAEDAKQSPSHAPLSFLGLACAVGVSSIYYNQPLLLDMANTYHATAGHTGFVAVATQVGYACGLLLFVPLGDVLERRSLMMRMYGGVAVALLLVALAPNLTSLILASVLVGVLASVTHIVLPIAPDLVTDAQRGRAIGIVMTGLLLGVLLARTFSGWISKIHGWRWVYVAAAVINASFVPLLWRKMPRLEPRQSLRYGQAMRSLWTLVRTQPLLRESCVIGALAFASFSCFWTTLAFLLDSHYGLGAGVAGTFGIVGAAGAMVAPFAGRASDKHGPRWVVAVGLAILAASYLLLWGEEVAKMPTYLHIAGLFLGVVILDLGAQMTQVANQTRIFGLVPSARSRLNTVYMVTYFSGAAIGSALATIAWVRWHWNGVCVLAIALVALAALRHITGLPDVKRQDGQPMDTDAEMIELA